MVTPPPPRRRGWRIASLVVASAGILLALWAFVLEPRSLRVREHALALPAWPPACDGLRVAVLADLHVGSPFNRRANLDRVIALTNAARPDVVLLAGDYVIDHVAGGRFVAPEEIAAALAQLQAPGGVYGVLGNHDWWLGPQRVIAAFAAAGIPMLEDASMVAEASRLANETAAAAPCRLAVAGLSDFREGRHDVAAALAGVPADLPVIAFTHNPDGFPTIPGRVALTVAGHTHGGQVYLPGLGRLVVPSAYGERYAIGHVEEGARHLFVSPGIGTSILGVRFLVPPEISLLVLRTTPAG